MYVQKPFLHMPVFESLGGKRKLQGTENDSKRDKKLLDKNYCFV